MNRNAIVMIVVSSMLMTQGGRARNGLGDEVARDTVDVKHVMAASHEAVANHDEVRLLALFVTAGSTWLNVLSEEAYTRAKVKRPDVPKVRVSTYRTL